MTSRTVVSPSKRRSGHHARARVLCATRPRHTVLLLRTALVHMTTTSGQRMQGVPARRTAIPQRSTATHQRLLPAGRYEHEPLPLSRREGYLHVHWLVYVGLSMLIMLVGWVALSTLDFVGGTLTVVFRKKVKHNWPTVLQTIGQHSENSRPFGTSSMFSTALEACENNSVKKGRAHATDSLGEESPSKTTNKEKHSASSRSTSVCNHRCE